MTAMQLNDAIARARVLLVHRVDDRDFKPLPRISQASA
jgi:hypothetical protein